MRAEPWTVQETDTLLAAHRKMRVNDVRHLPVLRGKKLCGIVSQRDILEYRARTRLDWWTAEVSVAMRSPPQTCGPDDSLTEVVGRFAASKIGAMPVVAQGELLGIVTVTDLLAAEVHLAMAPTPRSHATAADAMTPGAITIGPDASLRDAARRLFAHGIRHLPVVDDAGAVIGMLSERDLRTHIGDPAKFLASHGRTALRVRDAMSQPAIAITSDRPVVELAALFEDARVGALPVVDKGHKLVGIVSYVDALRVLSQQ